MENISVSSRVLLPPLDLFADLLMRGSEKLDPRARDSSRAPLGHGLRGNSAQLGNAGRAAELVDEMAIKVAHSGSNCKHAYSDTASILSLSLGKIPYMRRTTGERIRDERVARNWTQQKLADEIKRVAGETVSRAAIAQWEKGGGLKPESVFAVADVMKLSPRWLVYEVGDKSAEPATAPLTAPVSDYGDPISDAEASMLRDLRELHLDRQLKYAEMIRDEANAARAYKALGHPPAVPDARVEEAFGPPPAVPPIERRHTQDRRRVFSSVRDDSPNSDQKRRALK